MTATQVQFEFPLEIERHVERYQSLTDSLRQYQKFRLGDLLFRDIFEHWMPEAERRKCEICHEHFLCWQYTDQMLSGNRPLVCRICRDDQRSQELRNAAKHELELALRELDAKEQRLLKQLQEVQRQRLLQRQLRAANRSENDKRRIRAQEAIRKMRPLVIARDGLTCGICGQAVEENDISIDHIIPVSLGGDDVLDNLQVAHRSCNSRKGARLLPHLTGNAD